MSTQSAKLLSALTGLLFSCVATAATTYTDNFSGASSSLTWLSLNDACLTAGNGTGSIKACTTPKDTAGSGALRLTSATNNRTGAILSDFTFPLSQGMQVTFTTYTYGGSKDGTAKNGADGISFMLTDGTATAPKVAGGLGGSLGYSCSNINDTYEGMANAYLGLGVDEYGNYLNSGDNTNTGILNSNATGGSKDYGTNSFGDKSSGYYQPERIGLRGAGNTTWAWLNSKYPSYYTGNTPDKGKVTAACKSGQYVSGAVAKDGNGQKKGDPIYSAITNNYNAIVGGYKILPDNLPIAANNATTRGAGWPITYKLTLSPAGLLNFSYSYNNGAFQPVLVNSLITASNGPLPASFRFGFSAGTGGSNNVHEITCFQASPLQSNSSAGANTVQSGEVKTGTQIYLASYSADNWWGSLQSVPLVTTGGTLSVSSVASWDAKCVLTGGACDSMGTDAQGKPIKTVAVQGPAARTLMTWGGVNGKGSPLQWTSLSPAQQTSLNSTDSAGQNRLKWLRGDRTVEQLQSPPGTLRARNVVLGDIINSSPTWVGAPYSDTYSNAFSDGLYGVPGNESENQTGAPTYNSFASANATRLNVVYVGGNDGFLHGFRAGAYTAAGTYVNTNNDGREILGFMPSGVLASKTAKLTDPLYAHDYLVDATPGVGDLFYGNAWHTWLVGGVGSSGKEIYALDITNPAGFSEGTAPSVVIGDWTSATAGMSNLGNTVGTPIIARLHNGQWAVIFGNGLGSGTTAGVYIGLVDKTSGAIGAFRFLDTGVGSASSQNGITYVTSVDLDGDRIADYLYAGDLQGNVWRFDLTSNDPTKWVASKFGNAAATPLFVAKDASGNRQPITTAVTVASVKTGDMIRDMVFFGTGQKTPVDATSGDKYATGVQTFYGIWDWDMAGWNGKSSVKYAQLTGTQAIARAALLRQTLVSQSTAGSDGQVLGYRAMSTTKTVCWQGSTTCAAGSNNQYGWLFDFPDAQEQIIYNPVMIGGAVVVSTASPPVISALQCNPGLQSGWTMAFDPASGGGLAQGFFPGADGSFGTGSDGSTVGGIRLDAVGSPTTVKSGDQTYLVTQTVKGSAALSKVNPPFGDNPSRVSWREIKY
ncbi:MAG: PilC/PilY family type IV pilus protein [Rhodanobacter sp.]